VVANKKPTTSPKGEKTSAPPLPIDPQSYIAAIDGTQPGLKVRAQEVVFRQGDPADAVFYIETGRIELTIISDDGKEGVIALLGPGDFFGEGCLVGQAVRPASAVALMASSLVRIEKSAMTRILHEKQDLSQRFTAFLIARNVQVEADLVDQLFLSAEKRLARFLLLLANFTADGEFRAIIPKVSQELLAAHVGTTRPRINKFLNKFRRLGLIEYNGEMKVHTALLNVILRD